VKQIAFSIPKVIREFKLTTHAGNTSHRDEHAFTIDFTPNVPALGGATAESMGIHSFTTSASKESAYKQTRSHFSFDQ
jgi:hypothetical protein